MIKPDNVRSIIARDRVAQHGGRVMDSGDAFTLGDWVVERDLNRLRRGECRVRVSPLAMDVLAYLAHPPGRVVGAEELVRELWNGRIVSDNPVYKIIAKLRRALRDDAEQPRYIETVRERGYRLVAPVNDVEPATTSPPISTANRRESELPHRMVVILPICAIGNHGDQRTFCDGLAEEFMVQLAKFNDIRVATDSANEKDSYTTLQATVRMSTDWVRITARLTRPCDGLQLWAGAYERKTADGVDGQISVAREVAHAVHSAYRPA